MLKISDKNLCENCFAEITGEPCSKCGYSQESYVRDPAVLPCGSALMGRYAVGRVIGMGGFGITYLAYDIKMCRRIAIKEFFPFGLAMRSDDHVSVAVSTNEESAEVFKNGAERFYEEARMVAGFNDNPNIVSVYDFFYENSTAYYTMEYLKGHSLKDHIVKNGVLTASQAVFLARCVSDALMTVHEANVLHRDVSPDNIMLCENGKVKLIDFGAARQVVADGSQSMSVILKPGFAPLEQYQKKGKQGPWTDIYSLGTTLFYAMTGIVPDDPMTRLEDDEKFEENNYSIDDEIWSIIRKAAQLKVKDRYGSISELISDLDGLSITAEPIINGSAVRTVAMSYGNTVRSQRISEAVPEAPAPVPAPAAESAPEEPRKKKFPAALVGIASAAAVAVLVICIAVLGKGGSDGDIADDMTVESTALTAEETTSKAAYDGVGMMSPDTTSLTKDTTTAAPPAGGWTTPFTSPTSPVTEESEVTAVPNAALSENEDETEPSETTPKLTETTAATAPKVTTAPKPSETTATTTAPKVTTAPKPSETTTTTPKPAEVTTTTPKPVEVKTEVVIGGQTYSTDLTELDLSRKGLNDSDVKELKYMTKLTKLSLGGNNLTDISFVKEMPDLKELNIQKNNISDISAVKGLNELEIIGGYDNPVSDISALKGKKSLTLVSFSDSNVTDLSPLSGCTNITSISFDNCNIGGSLSALKDMSKLESVSLINCGINDISPLAGKKKLDMIFLNDNMISDVSPLKDCKSISCLYLENNSISETSINSFYGLSITNQIVLKGNGLTKEQAQRINAKLKVSPDYFGY